MLNASIMLKYKLTLGKKFSTTLKFGSLQSDLFNEYLTQDVYSVFICMESPEL